MYALAIINDVEVLKNDTGYYVRLVNVNCKAQAHAVFLLPTLLLPPWVGKYSETFPGLPVL